MTIIICRVYTGCVMGKINKEFKKMDSDGIAEYVLNVRKKEKDTMPSFIAREFDIDKMSRQKRTCYRLVPKEGFNGTYLFYLYGSMMCRSITEQQWEFIASLALDTGAGIYVPIYPLAPEHSCKETFDMLIKEYADFRMGIDVKKAIMIGDSSGAGLALSLSLLAWDEGYRKPDQLILISPILDTEFFDQKLEEKMKSRAETEDRLFYNDAAKNFINDFWIKDYAVKTKYTSPFYEEYTDICDDVVLMASFDEAFVDYNKMFYQKAKQQGINIKYYEFNYEKHDFMIYSNSKSSKKAYGYLVDTINGSYDTSMHHLTMVKRMANWSKKYPEIIQSDVERKFLYDSKLDIPLEKHDMSEYRNLLIASYFSSCDQKVREYIMKHPNCTVIQYGCMLDDMFSRLDNGRITWYSIGSHNNMSVRRSMYGVRDREVTIGRNYRDYSWLDQIVCERKKGVIFVFNDSLANMRKNQVKSLFDEIHNKFSGAEIVFTTNTKMASFWCNVFKKTMINRKKRRFAVEDAYALFGNWSPEYKMKAEEAITKCVPKKLNMKKITRLGLYYNKITENYKLVHIKLGNEVYEVNSVI